MSEILYDLTCLVCQTNTTYNRHFEFGCLQCDSTTIYCEHCRKAISVLLNDQLFKCHNCKMLVKVKSLVENTPNINKVNSNLSDLNLGNLGDINAICGHGNVVYDPLQMRYISKVDTVNQIKRNMSTYIQSNRVNKDVCKDDCNFFEGDNVNKHDLSMSDWKSIVNSQENHLSVNKSLVHPYTVNNEILKPSNKENSNNFYNLTNNKSMIHSNNSNNKLLISNKDHINSSRIENGNKISNYYFNNNYPMRVNDEFHNISSNLNPISTSEKSKVNKNLLNVTTNEFNCTPEKYDFFKGNDNNNDYLSSIDNLSSISNILSKRTVLGNEDILKFNEEINLPNFNSKPKGSSNYVNQTQTNGIQNANYSLLTTRGLPIEKLLSARNKNDVYVNDRFNTLSNNRENSSSSKF